MLKERNVQPKLPDFFKHLITQPALEYFFIKSAVPKDVNVLHKPCAELLLQLFRNLQGACLATFISMDALWGCPHFFGKLLLAQPKFLPAFHELIIIKFDSIPSP